MSLAVAVELFEARGWALPCRRIEDARSLGCAWVTAETFPPSGMRVLYPRPWYRFAVP